MLPSSYLTDQFYSLYLLKFRWRCSTYRTATSRLRSASTTMSLRLPECVSSGKIAPTPMETKIWEILTKTSIWASLLRITMALLDTTPRVPYLFRMRMSIRWALLQARKRRRLVKTRLSRIQIFRSLFHCLLLLKQSDILCSMWWLATSNNLSMFLFSNNPPKSVEYPFNFRRNQMVDLLLNNNKRCWEFTPAPPPQWNLLFCPSKFKEDNIYSTI